MFQRKLMLATNFWRKRFTIRFVIWFCLFVCWWNIECPRQKQNVIALYLCQMFKPICFDCWETFVSASNWTQQLWHTKQNKLYFFFYRKKIRMTTTKWIIWKLFNLMKCFRSFCLFNVFFSFAYRNLRVKRFFNISNSCWPLTFCWTYSLRSTICIRETIQTAIRSDIIGFFFVW